MRTWRVVPRALSAYARRDIALDYPPFFAYFEWLLSIPARYVDERIVDLHNLNYDAWSVIAYQRTTVILTELVLGAAVHRSVELLVLSWAERLIVTQIHSWLY